MSWRTVIIHNKSKLDLQLDYLVVRGYETKRIHLSEIGILIIENTACSLTCALLCELNKRKVKVIFCDEKYNPSSELVSYYGSFDTSDKIRKQIVWTEETKGSVWTSIVSEKIKKQINVLEFFEKEEALLLKEYANQIQYMDKTNREGHAAKVYFSALFGKDFSREQDNPLNAALNYGYGILLSSFNREIVSSGYITQLGLFHSNTFNRFNFSSDLMEPFRPLVDLIVLRINPSKFELQQKLELVNLLNQTVYIDESMQYVSNAIKIYCKSVFDALENSNTSLIKFFDNELQIYENSCIL